MQESTLLLVGGGHAHVQVVATLASQPCTHARRVLLSDGRLAVYSGMLPSVISGILPLSAAEIDLASLTKRHGWEFIDAKVVEIKAAENKVVFVRNGDSRFSRESMGYSVLSLDVGSSSKPFMNLDEGFPTDKKVKLQFRGHQNPQEQRDESSPAFIPTRPIGSLLDRIQIFEAAARQDCSSVIRVVVVGSGAAGVELALAIQARLKRTLPTVEHIDVSIVGSAKDFCDQLGAAGPAVAREMRHRGIHVRLGCRAIGLERNDVLLNNGDSIPADLVLAATGAAPHSWFQSATDLNLDGSGFFAVEPTLRARGYTNVFAAGDCCSFDGYFGKSFPPKAGVYAVRAGPVLAKNLESALAQRIGRPSEANLVSYSPQKAYLSLISLGDSRIAIGTKWNFVVRGRWVYNLKLFLDKQWQSRFQEAPQYNKANLDQYGNSQFCAKKSYRGTPAEAAAALFSVDHQEQDDFTEQLSILERMDKDHSFLDQVKAVASDTPR